MFHTKLPNGIPNTASATSLAHTIAKTSKRRGQNTRSSNTGYAHSAMHLFQRLASCTNIDLTFLNRSRQDGNTEQQDTRRRANRGRGLFAVAESVHPKRCGNNAPTSVQQPALADISSDSDKGSSTSSKEAKHDSDNKATTSEPRARWGEQKLMGQERIQNLPYDRSSSSADKFDAPSPSSYKSEGSFSSLSSSSSDKFDAPSPSSYTSENNFSSFSSDHDSPLSSQETKHRADDTATTAVEPRSRWKKQNSIGAEIAQKQSRDNPIHANPILETIPEDQPLSFSQKNMESKQADSGVMEFKQTDHEVIGPEHEWLKDALKDVKAIKQFISDEKKVAYDDMSISNEDLTKIYGKLDQLQQTLIKETQQVQTKAMLLALLKKAATPTKLGEPTLTVTEAIDTVKSKRFIKHQPEAVSALDRIAENLDDSVDLKNIDVCATIIASQATEKKPTSTDLSDDDTGLQIDIDTIREAMVSLASRTTKFDKQNTGLHNSIIIDSEANVIALKNSIDTKTENTGDDIENKELRERLSAAEKENHNENTRQPITNRRTHKHPKKQDHVKGILGKGGVGKIRYSEDILTEELYAIKKIKRKNAAEEEFSQVEKLREKLKNNPDDLKYFLTPETIAEGFDKRGREKFYLKSQIKDGDASDEIEKMHKIKNKNRRGSYIKYREAHTKLANRLMTLAEVLERNNMVHSDLKWENIIGGDMADLDGISFAFGDKISVATGVFVPPETDGPGSVHPSEESYKKHTSFIVGRMLLDSIEPGIMEDVFPLPTREGDRNKRPLRGYSKTTPIPEKNSKGKRYTAYEKDVIRLAYSLADNDPANRPTIAEAKARMLKITAKHTSKLRNLTNPLQW